MRQQGIRVAISKGAKHHTDTDYNVVAMTGILDDNYSNEGYTMGLLKPLQSERHGAYEMDIRGSKQAPLSDSFVLEI